MNGVVLCGVRSTGTLRLGGALHQVRRHFEALAHHDQRHLELEQPVDRLAHRLRRQRGQVGHLGLRQDLDALGKEVLDEPHQRHARPMDVADRDLGGRGQRLGQLLELQFLLLVLEQAGRAQGLHGMGALGPDSRPPAGGNAPAGCSVAPGISPPCDARSSVRARAAVRRCADRRAAPACSPPRSACG